MAGTLGDMKARIALELARSDLTAQIASAISDAIAICQKYRFRFSETFPATVPAPGQNEIAPYFTTVALQTVYPFPAPGFYAIDYMELQLPGPSFALSYMRRVQPEMARHRGQVGGVPNCFAVEGNFIWIGPFPMGGAGPYNIFPHGHIKIGAPADDGEADNVWMTQGERMIRVLAKREIARDVTRNPTMFETMNKAFIEEAVQLISEAGRLELYRGLMLRQENVKPQEDVIAP